MGKLFFRVVTEKSPQDRPFGISGASISAASFLSYIFLQKTGFHHAFIIAGLMFAWAVFSGSGTDGREKRERRIF